MKTIEVKLSDKPGNRADYNYARHAGDHSPGEAFLQCKSFPSKHPLFKS